MAGTALCFFAFNRMAMLKVPDLYVEMYNATKKEVFPSLFASTYGSLRSWVIFFIVPLVVHCFVTIAWAKRRAAQEMRNNGLSGKNCSCIKTLFCKCGRQDRNAQLQAKTNNVIDDGDIEMKDNAMLKYVMDGTKKKLGKKGRKGRGRNGKEDKKLLVAGEENSDWLTHSDPKTGKDYFSNKNTGRVTWSDPKLKGSLSNDLTFKICIYSSHSIVIETKR